MLFRKINAMVYCMIFVGLHFFFVCFVLFCFVSFNEDVNF